MIEIVSGTIFFCGTLAKKNNIYNNILCILVAVVKYRHFRTIPVHYLVLGVAVTTCGDTGPFGTGTAVLSRRAI